MTHPSPDQGHETPINPLRPPPEHQQAQPQPPPEEPYLHPEIQQARLFGHEAWKQFSRQFGLDQMTPAQRKRWLWRVGLLCAAPILIASLIFRGFTGFVIWILIGAVVLMVWTTRRLKRDRQRAAERVRRLNDQERRR